MDVHFVSHIQSIKIMSVGAMEFEDMFPMGTHASHPIAPSFNPFIGSLNTHEFS